MKFSFQFPHYDLPNLLFAERLERPLGWLCLRLFLGLALAASSVLAQPTWNFDEPGVLKIPPSVTTLGVPQIPLGTLVKHGYYQAHGGLGLVGWGRDGSLFLLGSGAETPAVVQLTKPGGESLERVPLPANYYDVYLSPEARRVAYTTAPEGDERYQLYVNDASGKIPLLVSPPVRGRNVEPLWSPSGRFLVYGHTPEGFGGMKLMVTDLQTRQSKVIAQAGTALQASTWSADERTLVYVEYFSNLTGRLWKYDTRSGTKTPLTPPERNNKFTAAVFAPDGQRIYVITDFQSEFAYLGALDLASGQITRLAGKDWEVEEFTLTPDGRHLVFTQNEDGASRLYRFDVDNQQLVSLNWMRNGVISRLRVSPDGVNLAFVFAWARGDSDVYTINLATGAATAWKLSGSAGFPLPQFTEPNLISWESFDGRRISGYLYRPPAKFSSPRPVLIELHGGPDDQARPTLSAEEYFVQEGVAVIYPNFRGSTGYGKTFAALDNKTNRLDAAKDIGALLDWITRQPDLDARRVVVKGSSYGGYLALSVAMLYSAKMRGAISHSGPTDLISTVERTAGWRRATRRAEYGDERLAPEANAIRRLSPLSNTKSITIPLLITHGARDPRVPARDARRFVAAVQRQATPVWFVLSQQDGHALQFAWDVQIGSSIMFIRQYLLN